MAEETGDEQINEIANEASKLSTQARIAYEEAHAYEVNSKNMIKKLERVRSLTQTKKTEEEIRILRTNIHGKVSGAQNSEMRASRALNKLHEIREEARNRYHYVTGLHFGEAAKKTGQGKAKTAGKKIPSPIAKRQPKVPQSAAITAAYHGGLQTAGIMADVHDDDDVLVIDLSPGEDEPEDALNVNIEEGSKSQIFNRFITAKLLLKKCRNFSTQKWHVLCRKVTTLQIMSNCK